jgi:hypothetical protein
LFGGTLGDLRTRRRERVVVEVDRPPFAAFVLRQAGFEVEDINEAGLTVELPRRDDIARAATTLISAGLSLYQLRTVRASLEDLFLDLTSGTSLGSPSAEEVTR